MRNTEPLVIVLCLALSLSACGRKQGTTTLAAWLREMGADVYSVTAMTEYTAASMTLPLPQQDPIPPDQIGGILFRPGTVLDQRVEKRLQNASNLRLLDLSGCKISDDFFDSLTLNKLEVVEASESNLADVHCDALASLPNLKLVIARETIVTPLGLEVIRGGVANAEATMWYR